MKPSDLNHMSDAVRHLAMAKTCLNRMSAEGRETASRVAQQQIDEIARQIETLEDKLGNAHLDIKRMSVGKA